MMIWYYHKEKTQRDDEVASKLAKTGIHLCILALLGVILGVLLMTAIGFLPVNRIELHVRESAEVMKEEGDYCSLFPHVNTRLDNITDTLMMMKAAYRRTEEVSPVESAMMVYHVDKGPFWQGLEKVGDDPEEDPLDAYPRYWHGYLLFLRPALMFLNYKELRIVNLYFQVALVSLLCVMMSKRDLRRFIVPFLILVLCQSPYTTSCSLQNSTIYYLYLLSSLLLVACYQKLRDSGALPYVFTLVGIATAFLDFLTYPLVSFGVPVVFCMIQERGTLRSRLRLLAVLGAAWLIGYGGMWAGKWVAASLLTGQNVIQDALTSAKYRAGSSFRGSKIPLWDTLLCNLMQLEENPVAILLAITAAVIFLAGIVTGRGKKMLTEGDAVLLLVMFLPLAWYAALRNHSFIHGGLFTWRELLISVFALACWVREKIDCIRSEKAKV